MQGPPMWPADTPVPDIGAMHAHGPGPTSMPGLLALGYSGSNVGPAHTPPATGGSPQNGAHNDFSMISCVAPMLNSNSELWPCSLTCSVLHGCPGPQSRPTALTTFST